MCNACINHCGMDDKLHLVTTIKVGQSAPQSERYCGFDKFMKLSPLTPTDKIKLAAELDGWKPMQKNRLSLEIVWQSPEGLLLHLPNYSTSYDAIIPLIQKLKLNDNQWIMFRDSLPKSTGWNSQDALAATPSQLLDALLVATGKCKE
jgi:hypothetical protein